MGAAAGRAAAGAEGDRTADARVDVVSAPDKTPVEAARVRVDAFLDAKRRVRARLDADPEAQDAAFAADLRVLLGGHPPEPGLPETFATFSAAFVPFLAPAARGGPDGDVFDRGGITVTPWASGEKGATLVATDGRVLLLARDPEASASAGGVRVLLSPDALAACRPPPPSCLFYEGDGQEIPPPAWAMPDTVYTIGASFLVLPKEQPPPEPGEEADPEDGGVLFGRMVETGNVWREDDCRRLDPIGWQRVLRKLGEAPVRDGPPVMNDRVLAVVAEAMQAAPIADARGRRAGWICERLSDALLFRPTEPRAELAIIAMRRVGEEGLSRSDWLADLCGVTP